MQSRLEQARQRAADLIAQAPDPTRLVEVRRLQEQIATLKNRHMFCGHEVSNLEWVDDWQPGPERIQGDQGRRT